MVIYIICSIVAILASALTFFSGFGLGTILTPVFAIFFPIDIAIAMTGIVHFLNGLFKFSITYKNINKEVLISFGIPSFFASMVGALLLNYLNHLNPIYTYSILNHTFVITPIKFGIGLIVIFYTIFENNNPASLSSNRKNVFWGGILSGFSGGLSGNQGALRSMVLKGMDMSKESFIATGIAIALLTDISRLSIYSQNIISSSNNLNYFLILIVTLSAFAGAFIGNKILIKATNSIVNKIVTAMLLTIGLSLCMGWV